jgi:hypothetical protein
MSRNPDWPEPSCAFSVPDAKPEGFDPCAIAGERFTAATSARAVVTGNRVFISDLPRVRVLPPPIRPREAELGVENRGRIGRYYAGRPVCRRVRRVAIKPGGFLGAVSGIIGGQRKCPLGIIAMFCCIADGQIGADRFLRVETCRRWDIAAR